MLLPESNIPRIFVVDEPSRRIVEALAKSFRAQVDVVDCGSTNTLLDLYHKATAVFDSRHLCFIVPFGTKVPSTTSNAVFLALEQLSLIDCLFDPRVAEANSQKHPNKIARSFLASHDPKAALLELCSQSGMAEDDYLAALVKNCRDAGVCEQVFPAQLIDAIISGIDDSGALCS